MFSVIVAGKRVGVWETMAIRARRVGVWIRFSCRRERVMVGGGVWEGKR